MLLLSEIKDRKVGFMILKCKMCGGTMNSSQGESVAVCEYCGTKQTLPRLDSDKKANFYDRANHFRRNNEFDKAMGIYEQILDEDGTDAEAYWSLVLCRFGIEYVEDPATHMRVPTVNRAQFTSIYDDDNYKLALQHADSFQKELYEKEAEAINEIQKNILAISQKEEPFDVFICYKETDSAGNRTQDSVLANELYHELTDEGFKVFYSRITLEDKLGTAYEPYIFAALNSSKVMVVLGTKPEYFNAAWVKNEWSRYLALIKGGTKKVLIPAFRDMDPYDLPEEFSHLQAQDMSKLGFMPDLIRGIKKLVEAEDSFEEEPDSDEAGGSVNTVPLLKRVFLFLEDGDWKSADEYCERVLDADPENAMAYLGKLMAELHVPQKEQLQNCDKTLDEKNNYRKAIRFADEQLKAELAGYNQHIIDRMENERLVGIYTGAKTLMDTASNEYTFKEAANTFKSISGFQDADALAEKCLELAETARKNSIYNSAVSNQKNDYQATLERAIELFECIPDWKDSAERASACRARIDELKAEDERRRIKREESAMQMRMEAEKRAQRTKKIAVIAALIACAIIVFLILWNTVIIPYGKYKSAMEIYDEGKYSEAYAAFNEINFKDSSAKAEESARKAEEVLFSVQKSMLSNVAVGDTIKFGFYEQDNDTLNGKEEIEWIVLAIEENRALIISKYAIDCLPYNTVSYSSNTWEECSLRTWLNDTFYSTAFSTQHQRLIVPANVPADKIPEYDDAVPGNNTQDNIFLLSSIEANQYFQSETAKQCEATAYANAQGSNDIASKYICWWLRSSGDRPIPSNAEYVSLSANDAVITFIMDNGLNGSFVGGNIFIYDYGVRPAMWITVDS